MASVPCSQCGDPVDLEENGCPRCREAKWRSRRPKLLAAGAAAAALTGLVWLQRAPLKARAEAGWRDFSAEVERTRDPAHLTGAAPAAAPPPAISSFAYIGGPPAETSVPENAPAAEASAPPAREELVSAPPAPAAPREGMRRWYGVVYDLESLKPIGGAQLKFANRDGGIDMSATTDGSGRYSIDMYKSYANGKVSATISTPAGYRAGLLEDRDPPLREQSREARRMVIDETTDSDLEPVPLRAREDADVRELDFVLLPSAKK